jgi:hypothetical protein
VEVDGVEVVVDGEVVDEPEVELPVEFDEVVEAVVVVEADVFREAEVVETPPAPLEEADVGAAGFTARRGTVIDTVCGDERTPSLAAYVNESVPEKPTRGV